MWRNADSRRRTNGELEVKTETNAARGQPPRAASFRKSSRLPSRCLSAVGRWHRSDSTLLIRERHIYRCCRRAVIFKSRLCDFRGGQRPNPAHRAGSGGGRNARATSHARASRFPPAIHPRELPVCHWLRRNHRLASFKRSTYSVISLCGRECRLATEKHCTLVQKLWRMILPCGRLRKKMKELSGQPKIAILLRCKNNRDVLPSSRTPCFLFYSTNCTNLPVIPPPKYGRGQSSIRQGTCGTRE